MIKALSNYFFQKSTKWFALSAITVFGLFVIFILPNQAAKMAAYSHHVGSPDTSFIYSAEQLYQMAEEYGESGRVAYVRERFTFDLIFPIIYTGFLIISTSWLLDRVLDPNSSWREINLLPIMGVLFDLLENISASLVMSVFPKQLAFIASLTPILTFLKWIFVVGCFLLLLVSLSLFIWKKIKA